MCKKIQKIIGEHGIMELTVNLGWETESGLKHVPFRTCGGF